MQKVEVKPFKIIGIAVRTTNENGKAAQDIPALWNRFMKEGIPQRISNKVNDEVYSMYTDYEGDHTQPYTTIIGCQVSSIDTIPEGMVAHEVIGGSYVKTSATGDIMKGIVINKWNEIWASDINRAYTADYEVYGEKSRDMSNAEVEFYIAIN